MYIILFCVCFLFAVYAEQQVKIVLSDVNDERPTFINTPRPFLATVSSTAPPGTSVYQLLARDEDQTSDIRYNLESGQSTTAVTSCALTPHATHRVGYIYMAVVICCYTGRVTYMSV